jgi:YfiH family protein
MIPFIFFPKKKPKFIINKKFKRFDIKEGFTLKTKNPYKLIKKYFNINVYTGKQIHSDKIKIITEKNRIKKFKADAFITDKDGIAIGVRVADCVGTVIFDKKNKIIAAVHSGWRGIANKIIAKTIKKMKKIYKTKPDDLIVSMSPAIGKCCYEIGYDLFNKLKKQKVFSNIFEKRQNKIYMDLHKANLNLLLKEKVKRKNIYINNMCTYCNKNLFFSYRREGEKAGRMIYFIMLKKGK